MAFKNAAGVTLTKATLTALTTAEAAPRRFTADVYETITFPGIGSKFESGTRLKFKSGQVVPQSYLDGLFPTATVTSIEPAEGDVAGGVVVTVKGTNLAGVTGVNFGATAGTAFKSVSNTEVQVTTPARGSAGTVNVVVKDDNADVTVNNGFEYTEEEEPDTGD